MTGWFSRLLSRPAPAGAARAPPESEALGPPRRTWIDRLDAWLARVLDTTRLGAIIGQRQADYLARLMDMFERGDLDAALKHAMPLGGTAVPGQTQPTLGVPSPRESLDISLRRDVEVFEASVGQPQLRLAQRALKTLVVSGQVLGIDEQGKACIKVEFGTRGVFSLRCPSSRHRDQAQRPQLFQRGFVQHSLAFQW